jgi:hypothetical protein
MVIYLLLLLNSLLPTNNLEEYTSKNSLMDNIETTIVFGQETSKDPSSITKNVFNSLDVKKINNSYQVLKSHKVNHHRQDKKKWTILIYIAGANDLYKYALRNIEQMMQVGSNEQLNILIHFDFHIKGKQKETKRLYVEKNSLLQIGDLPPHDSGDAQSLIEASQWAINNYPSTYFGLILWNHGTGSCDPHFMRKIVNPNDFFYYNKQNHKISLDRSREFLQYIENNDNPLSDRGICFDDTTRNYLDNKKLALALEKIYLLRNKKKIDVLLMDACLMSGIEVAYQCEPYANYLVSSQEVVLGPGYNYAATLKPLQKENLTPYDFALSTVKIFAQTYAPISNDFTQSAINLNTIAQFVTLFTEFVDLLSKYKQCDNRDHLKKTIRLAGSREMVTHFSEPSYIDLIHFLENINNLISQNPKKIVFTKKEIDYIKEIKQFINKKLIPSLHKIIIANVSGDGIPKAHGIYIYFPKYQIDESYKNTTFPILTKWIDFLQNLKN